MHPVAVVGDGVDEVQEHARVAAHGAGHVAEHHQRRLALGAGAALERHQVAAGAQARAQRGAHVDAPAERIGPVAPRRHRLDRQPERRDRPLRLRQLVRRHVLEVHLLQHFLGREGEHRVELDLDVLLGSFRPLRAVRGRDGLAGAPARRRRLRLGQPVGGHDRPLNRALQADLAPEQPKGLVEEVVLIAPLDEHGVERPVEIAAPDGVDRLDGAHRLDGLAGPRRQAGAAQAPHEVHDVVGERAARLGLERHRVPGRHGRCPGRPAALRARGRWPPPGPAGRPAGGRDWRWMVSGSSSIRSSWITALDQAITSPSPITRGEVGLAACAR